MRNGWESRCSPNSSITKTNEQQRCIRAGMKLGDQLLPRGLASQNFGTSGSCVGRTGCAFHRTLGGLQGLTGKGNRPGASGTRPRANLSRPPDCGSVRNTPMLPHILLVLAQAQAPVGEAHSPSVADESRDSHWKTTAPTFELRLQTAEERSTFRWSNSDFKEHDDSHVFGSTFEVPSQYCSHPMAITKREDFS